MNAVRRGVPAHADDTHPTLGMSLPDSDGGPCTIRGALTGEGLMGVKSVGSFPRNREAGLPPDPGLFLLHDGRTGMPRAILEGSFLATVRTVAACRHPAGLGRTREHTNTMLQEGNT